jgi:ribonuclease HI
MAQALRNKDVATLQELGLMVPEGADPFTEDREWTVMILVEGPEHGEQLHRLLPEWRLHTAVPLPPDRLPVIRRTTLDADNAHSPAAKASQYLREHVPTTTEPRLLGQRNRFQLYTDGCCLPESGVGGWTWRAKDERIGEWQEQCGSLDQTTNNRAELTALIHGIEALPDHSIIKVMSDSTYIVDGVNYHLLFWLANGWRTKTKAPLKNEDLWRRAAAALEYHKVSASWIPAHSGHPQNELCDQQARNMAERQLEARS